MKKLFGLLAVVVCSHGWAQTDDTLYFKSEKELANYAFQNTDFNALNVRFFKDRMFDYDPAVFDDYTNSEPGRTVYGYNAFQLSKHAENWDVEETFQADSVLHPVLSRFFSLDGQNAFHLPLIIMDINVFELKQNVKEDFEANTVEDELRALLPYDLDQRRVDLTCLPLDSLNYPNLWLDLDERFIVQNTGRNVDYVTISDGNNSVVLFMGQSVDISSIFRNGSTLTIETHFDDNTVSSFRQNVYYVDVAEKVEEKSLNLSFTNTIEERYPFGDGPTEEHPVGKMSISYACTDKVLRKPYLMIAGWGPYTDINALNSILNWPTPMWKMANQMNQSGLIETLNDQGFDVAILQIFPPNASMIGNAVVIEDVINVLNQRAAENGYHEEIIVQGYSAGSLGARLALQTIEKKHLEQNGPHPHCRLYVSTDGEHLGANLPLGIQHAVQYLWDYEAAGFYIPKIYALRYILRAPQSRQLLVHWYETMDDNGNVGCDALRSEYLNNQFSQDHAFTDLARSGFPTFGRNISISNGMHTPQYDLYNNYNATHVPLPSQTGRLIFEDAEGRHRSKIRYSSHGFHEVFLYRRRSWGNWAIKMRGVMNNQLVLDNAPGGMMFIRENPLNAALKTMAQETFGEASTLEYTNFCFTPTVFTHNIKNYQSHVVNGYIDYKLKNEGLMYRTPQAVVLLQPDDNYGYPHLAYPADHFLITPFEAVFTCTEITEHLRFDRQENSNNPDGPEDFYGVPSLFNENNYKNFVVDEAEGFSMYSQNKKIGYYARPNFDYYVDYTALHKIYWGQHVTNKTDFLPLSVETNAHVNAMAGVEINLKPGVHIKKGSEVYLHIGELECEKSVGSSHGDKSQENRTLATSDKAKFISSPEENIVLYPNPSNNAFSIENVTIPAGSEVGIRVCGLNGVELLSKSVTLGESIVHELPKGTYIVYIKLEGLWTSKLLFVD